MIQRFSHGTPADPIINRKNRSASVSLFIAPVFGSPGDQVARRGTSTRFCPGRKYAYSV